MLICWPAPKAIRDPETGQLVRVAAGEPYEMPDEEAEDRIRQGDCTRWVAPDPPAVADPSDGHSDAEATEAGDAASDAAMDGAAAETDEPAAAVVTATDQVEEG